MTATSALFDVVDGGVVLRVHVQRGASSTAVAGCHGDALKVKVASPPVDGRANEALASTLADLFGLRRAAVVLVSGHTSRSKRFRLVGADPMTVAATLEYLLTGSTRR